MFVSRVFVRRDYIEEAMDSPRALLLLQETHCTSHLPSTVSHRPKCSSASSSSSSRAHAVARESPSPQPHATQREKAVSGRCASSTQLQDSQCGVRLTSPDLIFAEITYISQTAVPSILDFRQLWKIFRFLRPVENFQIKSSFLS